MRGFKNILEICLFVFYLVYFAGPTSAAFPDGYIEVRKARVNDRFYDMASLKLWLAWTDLDGFDYMFRLPSVDWQNSSPSYEDQQKTFNSSSFTCGWSGIRFQHQGGKEVFPVHPACSRCKAFFKYLKPMGCCLPHGMKVEMRCYRRD